MYGMDIELNSLSERQCICLCYSLMRCEGNASSMFVENSEMSLFIWLLENESCHVSFCAKDVLLSLYKSFTSQPDKKLKILFTFISKQLASYVWQIENDNATNELALMHILDLSLIVLREQEEYDGKQAITEHLLSHWTTLFNYVFSQSLTSCNKLSLIRSALKLYIRILKLGEHIILQKDLKFRVAYYLLEKMKFKEVPKASLQKVLALIYHCCPDFSDKTLNCEENVRVGVLRMCKTLVEMGSHDDLLTGSSSLKDIVFRSDACCLFIGLGNVHDAEAVPMSCDLLLLRAAFLVIAKCSAFLATFDGKVSHTEYSLGKKKNIVSNILKDLSFEPNALKMEHFGLPDLNFIFHMAKKLFPCTINPHRQLMTIFVDQDDELIKFLLFTLHSSWLSGDDKLLVKSHLLFLEMLEMIQWSHFIFIDWLISPETVFIHFFLKQLKCIISRPELWINACSIFDKSQSCDFGQTYIKRYRLENAGQNALGTELSLTATRKHCGDVILTSSCNLTAYSDTDESGDETQISTHSKPNIQSHWENVFLSKSDSHPKSSTVSPRLELLTSKKTSRTFIATATAIEKLNLSGMFPYNPGPLLKLLGQFHKFDS